MTPFQAVLRLKGYTLCAQNTFSADDRKAGQDWPADAETMIGSSRWDSILTWVADSFEGVPKPDPDKYPADAAEQRKAAFYMFDQLAVSVRFARRAGVLSEGLVSRHLAHDPSGAELAVIRLDGDLYESTWDALTGLYPKLSPGGYCLIDDYGGIPACRNDR